jgi:hypothetical protein
LTVAFIVQVPVGPAREVLDVIPLMMNRQDTFVSGASWVRVKSKFSSLSFDHFWWAKVGLYDRKNQEVHEFWQNADLTSRQAKHLLFGSRSGSVMLDNIEDEVAIDFIFGRGRLSLDEEGKLKVPKPEPMELDEHDPWRMCRVRVLEGDLSLVRAMPVL